MEKSRSEPRRISSSVQKEPSEPSEPSERYGCLLSWWSFLHSNWVVLAISVAFILLTAGQTVTLPLWASSLANGTGSHFSGPYVILLYTSLSLATCNGIASLLSWVLFEFPSTPPFWHNFGLYMAVGGSLAVNGLVLVYAALPNRTPGSYLRLLSSSNFLEMLQALLLNTGFIFSIPASKFLVEEKSKYIFCAWKPIIAIVLVIWGIVISLIPLIELVYYGDGMLSSQHYS